MTCVVQGVSNDRTILLKTKIVTVQMYKVVIASKSLCSTIHLVFLGFESMVENMTSGH